MKSEKAISMMILIITIVVIVILAATVVYFSVDTIENATQMNMAEEMRNVEEIVLRQRTRIIAGEYVPDSSRIMSSAEVDDFFSDLSAEKRAIYVQTIQNIKDINNSNIDDINKFYKYTPAQFKQEYDNDISVTTLSRTYIINYGLDLILALVNGDIADNGDVPDLDYVVNEGSIIISITRTSALIDGWTQIASASVVIGSTDNLTLNPHSYRYAWGENAYTKADFRADPSLGTAFQTIPQIVSASNVNVGGTYILSVYAESMDGNISKVECCSFNVDNVGPDGILTITDGSGNTISSAE